MKIISIFLFILFLQFFSPGACAQQAILINKEFSKAEIGKQQIYYLAAGDSLKTLEEAQSHFKEHYFIPSKYTGINLGIAKDNYWVHLLLVNASGLEQALYLNLENPRLNQVDVYLIQKKQIDKIIIGDDFPFKQRPVNLNVFSLPLTFAVSDSIEIYFFIKHKGNTLQVPISLYNKDQFLKETENNYLYFGVTIGMLFIILFFCIFFIIKYFSKLFLFYGLYIFSILGWLWSTEGYGFQYFWPLHPEWATRFGPGFSVFNLFTFTLVVLEFCKPYDTKSLIRKIIRSSLVITAIWAVIPFLPLEVFLTASLMSVFLKTNFTIYIIILSTISSYLFWLSYKKNKLVLYYFFAVIISIVSTLLVIAKHSGYIQINIPSGKFMSGGIILEIILMTAGITRQLYSYKQEKEDALRTNAEQQKTINARILKMQEAERMRISSELHDDLGGGLTQITLMGEYAKQQIKKGHSGSDEINDISETSRQLVEKVSEIIWTMNPVNNSIAELLIYLRVQLYKMLEYTSKECDIDFQEVNNSIIILNEQRRNIILVLKEIVHNIIKHSKAEHVKVSAHYFDEKLEFKIEDDGVGFDTSLAGRGNGLRNIKNRIKAMGSKVEIISVLNKGTIIQFEVLLKSHL